MKTEQRTKALFVSVLTHAALLCATLFALYPILWVIGLALSPSQTPKSTVIPFPSAPSLNQFIEVIGWNHPGGTWLFATQLFNSIAISLTTAIVAIAIATPAAYALARFDFVGARGTIRAMLATQMFPGVAAAIPLYLLLSHLHLLDTRAGLILVYATSAVPFAIFQLRSTFLAIPPDLEEAAMVDGASRVGAFLRVVLPAAKPALAVTCLFAFMTAWNEFILAATFLSEEDRFTLPVVLQRYVGEHNAQWGHFAAGACIASIPVMALFYYLQRQMIAGLTAGSVKG